MKRYEIKSVLERVIQQVWAEPNVKKAKDLMLTLVNDTKIKDEDKKRIQLNLDRIHTKPKLDLYIANSLLMYEGHGVKRAVK